MLGGDCSLRGSVMGETNEMPCANTSTNSYGRSNEELRTKWSMALNPNTPAKVLAELAENAPVSVLERIAENPRVSPETLSKLSVHSCSSVRAAVAENTNTYLDILLELMHDECVDVRYSIAENHAMPLGVLQSLQDDENPYVASRARKTLSRLVENKVHHGQFRTNFDILMNRKVQNG